MKLDHKLLISERAPDLFDHLDMHSLVDCYAFCAMYTCSIQRNLRQDISASLQAFSGIVNAAQVEAFLSPEFAQRIGLHDWIPVSFALVLQIDHVLKFVRLSEGVSAASGIAC